MVVMLRLEWELQKRLSGGVAGFDFTRLSAGGSQYAGSGNYNSDPWGCVRDNHTGLTWEVKTDDGGIHDKDNTYRWGGKTSLVNESARTESWGNFYDDWDTLVDGSNNESFCGFADWRVPTQMELMTMTNKDTFNPAIDSNYFPNVRSSDYWSSSPMRAPMAAHGVFLSATATTPTVPEVIVTMCA